MKRDGKMGRGGGVREWVVECGSVEDWEDGQGGNIDGVEDEVGWEVRGG